MHTSQKKKKKRLNETPKVISQNFDKTLRKNKRALCMSCNKQGIIPQVFLFSGNSSGKSSRGGRKMQTISFVFPK